MKKLMLTLSVLFAMGFTACGPTNGGAVDPGPGQVAPLAPPPPDIRQCQIGQVFNTQYGCLNRGTCPYGQGVAPTGSCIGGTVVTGQNQGGGNYQQSGRWDGSLSIISRTTYEEVLKYTGLCDQRLWNWGAASCDQWVRMSSWLSVQVSGSSASTQVTMYFTVGSFSFARQADVIDHNNAQGMQFVTNDYMRAVIDSGRLDSSILSVRLYYRGVHFASANLQRR